MAERIIVDSIVVNINNQNYKAYMTIVTSEDACVAYLAIRFNNYWTGSMLPFPFKMSEEKLEEVIKNTGAHGIALPDDMAWAIFEDIAEDWGGYRANFSNDNVWTPPYKDV